MRSLLVLDAATGDELGWAKEDEAGIHKDGLAVDLIKALASNQGTERDAFAFYLAGWSNGYVATGPGETSSGSKHLSGRHNQDSHGGTGSAATLEFRELTSAEALAMQKEMLKGAPWTQAQEEALGEFSSDAYKQVNGLLRGTVELDNEDRDAYTEVAREVHAGMRPTTRSLTSYRRVGFEAFGVDPDDTQGVLALAGKKLQDRGIVSTSIDKAAIPGGRGGVDMEIEVPEGTPAAYIESIRDTPEELELVLAAGLKYNIISAVEGRGGTVQMRVRVTQ